MSDLFARIPVGRNLLNSDGHDPNLNLLKFDSRFAGDPHGAIDRLIGRAPTPDEISARMLNALNTPAKPDPAGDNLPDHGPFNSVHDAFQKARDMYDMYDRRFHGEGRREENVPELPWNVKIGDQNTWVSAKAALGRSNDRAVDDIALAQLPGVGFRRDRDGNLIVKLPDNATVPESYVTSAGADGPPIYDTQQQSVGGQEFYVNRPGFSGQDVVNGVAGMTPTIVGGSVYTALKKSPLAGRAAATAASAAAGTDILLDEWARAEGSRQPIGFAHAAEAGRERLLPWPLSWLLPGP